MGIVVRVEQLDHSGNEADVDEAKKNLSRWIHAGTTFKPNPKIAEEQKRQQQWKEYDAAMKNAELWDRKFRYFVFFPVLIAILLSLIWGAFSLHWVIGGAAVLLIGLGLWRVLH